MERELLRGGRSVCEKPCDQEAKKKTRARRLQQGSRPIKGEKTYTWDNSPFGGPYIYIKPRPFLLFEKTLAPEIFICLPPHFFFFFLKKIPASSEKSDVGFLLPPPTPPGEIFVIRLYDACSSIFFFDGKCSQSLSG